MHTAVRRATVAAAALALVASAAGVAPPPASAAADCQYACIDLPLVQTSPEAARFQFTTTGLTHSSVRVTDMDGSHAVVLGQQDGYFWSTDYDIVVPRPAQNTMYRYVVTATDTAGHTWQQSGQFATKTRTATVQLTQLHMDDDSDHYSAGDLEGAVRCTSSESDWKPLAPLAMDMADELQMETGTSMPLSATLVCVGADANLHVDTGVADDDNTGIPYDISWTPDGWYTGAGSSCCWDWNYTHSTVIDPIPAFGAGTALPVAFSATSAHLDRDGGVAALQYDLQGQVTFSDLDAPGGLPAPVAGPANLGLTVEGKPSELLVQWNAAALAGAYTTIGYRLDFRPTGQAAWSSVLLPTGSSSYALTGLLNGEQYDVRLALVDGQGVSFGLTTGVGTPAPLPSWMSGWSTVTSVLPYNSTVASTVLVTSGGAPRMLVLQRRPLGSTTWTYAGAQATDASGKATVTFPVLAGSWQWRVGAPTTAAYALVLSGSRTVTSATKVAGFSTTARTLAHGTTLSDGIVVTPGAGRLVKVRYRKSGSSTWTVYKSFTANASGAVTVQLVAKLGYYAWQVYVPASATRGAATTSASRWLHGT